MAESSLSSRLPSEANPKSEAAGRPLGRKGPWERARTRLSKLIGGLLLVGAGLTESNWEPQHNTFATFLYALGLVIVSIATSGRIWCSFYLSGHKDSKLTTEGPFSLCRNPLYFFSSLGVIGIGLCTETLTIPVTFALIFAIYYPALLLAKSSVFCISLAKLISATSRMCPVSFHPSATSGNRKPGVHPQCFSAST
jgi:hypothetical protein